MSNYVINGGKRLKGTVATNSAKNSAVAILAAMPMIPGRTTLVNVPVIEEVKRMVETLKSIDLKIKWIGAHELEIVNGGKISLKNLNQESFAKTRAALLLMGSLSPLFDRFSLPKGSGCKLGKRTVNPYKLAMEQMGFAIKDSGCRYEVVKLKPRDSSVTMHETGDTATENTIFAAILGSKKTEIYFASSNYMVQDLCCFLSAAGASISGIGTNKLVISGVKKLAPVENYPVMPDPVESMAFISIAITTKSRIKITRCPIDFLRLEIEKLRVMGQKLKISKIYKSENGYFDLVDIEVIPSRLLALPDKIHPLPYPGLNIDNLPLFVPILTQAEGKTLVHDWIYENRAIYYTELNKLGADVALYDPHRVAVTGPTELKPAEIISPPALRPSINLLIAMLAARGQSVLRNSYSIERGYEDIVGRLNKLGADIKRIE
ncbi:MAG: UDP-N-acetylglucosamine 1-carboxyvinyltransferase [Patescibacteria group bacterium]|jgi:UDP-N-acetylglucosamine 1-carboxyvinyltransferase